MRVVVMLLGLLAACAARADASFPEFDEPALRHGRAVWLGTCAACHANPLGDAPQVKDKTAWAPRLSKGRDALYRSALGGVSSSSSEMPPRGGNGSLGDADVRAAVDYMIKLVTR